MKVWRIIGYEAGPIVQRSRGLGSSPQNVNQHPQDTLGLFRYLVDKIRKKGYEFGKNDQQRNDNNIYANKKQGSHMMDIMSSSSDAANFTA